MCVVRRVTFLLVFVFCSSEAYATYQASRNGDPFLSRFKRRVEYSNISVEHFKKENRKDIGHTSVDNKRCYNAKKKNISAKQVKNVKKYVDYINNSSKQVKNVKKYVDYINNSSKQVKRIKKSIDYSNNGVKQQVKNVKRGIKCSSVDNNIDGKVRRPIECKDTSVCTYRDNSVDVCKGKKGFKDVADSCVSGDRTKNNERSLVGVEKVFFDSGEMMPTCKLFDGKHRKKRGVYLASTICQQQSDIEHKGVDKFAKSCQVLNKVEHKGGDKFNNSCQVLNKVEHKGVDKFAKSCQALKKVEDSTEVSRLNIKMVNEDGIPEPFDGFPHEDDIRLYSFTYCHKDVVSLDLSESGIEDLTPLRKLVLLRSLKVSGCSVTSLFPLKNLFALEYLDISDSSVKDVIFLSKLVNLRFLYCSRNYISDVSPLSGMAKLECLNLCHCPVVDISPLSNLLKLVCLFLEYTQIKDLTPLSKNVNLECLDLSNTDIVDLSPLSCIENLKEISLRECCCLSSLTPLLKMSNVVYLDLSWKDVFSNDDIKDIRALCNLQCLDLSNTDIDSYRLVLLSSGPLNKTLHVLHLNACNSLKQLYPLCGFTNLKELSLSFLQKRDLSALEKLSFLTRLSLKGNCLIDNIGFLWGMEFLEELDLSECVSLQCIDSVCNLLRLYYLNVSKCPKLFSAGSCTLSLFPFVNNLHVLDISYNKIDPSDVKKLRLKLKADGSNPSKRVICDEY